MPRSDEVTTNLHQLTSKKDGLKQLEEDLLQAAAVVRAQEFARWRGRSAAARPPATPAIQSKRVKEMLERRKNWVFMSPEDLLPRRPWKRFFKAPAAWDGWPGEEELPALERYYERLAAKRSAAR